MNPAKIPAISLWQPWASALFAPLKPGFSTHAIKLHETRHWPMPAHHANQWVAIHAAKRDTPAEREFWQDVVMNQWHRETYEAAFHAIGVAKYADLPRGCIIGKVRFAPSRQTKGQQFEEWPSHDWGNYSAGRYAWPVLECCRLATPILCVGRQGFFSVPAF